MNELSPLGRLIQAAQDDLGWSNRELERQAGDTRGLGKSNIGKLKKGTFEGVRAPVLKALATLIRVPEIQVVQAALETLDLKYTSDEPATLEDAVAADRSITERDKRILLAAVTEMKVSERHDREEEQEPGQETRRPQHSSPHRTEDGSTPQRSGAPIRDDLEQQRKKKRIADDPAAFGDQARRGDLDYRHQQERAGLAADTDEAAGRTTSEGVRQWEHADTLGEESQDPGDHHEP